MLGERGLILFSRMPRLAEWHAEAAAANVLARPEMTEALTALKQLGELPQALPDRLKVLQELDQRLAAMPTELAAAVGRQPELRETLASLEQTAQQMKALEGGVASLDKSVRTLAEQLGQLTTATQPASVQQLADRTSDTLMRQARSLVLLATGCAAAVVLLHALLRRWGARPQRRE